MQARRGTPALFVLLLLLCACDRQQERFQTAAQLTGGGNAEAGMDRPEKIRLQRVSHHSRNRRRSRVVGPPLNQFAERVYIAGRLPNTPENLMLWIQKPQQVVPNNAMPDMGIGEQDSRDIAAYLYTLR